MKRAMGLLLDVIYGFIVPFISSANLLAAALCLGILGLLIQAVATTRGVLNLEGESRYALQEYYIWMGSKIEIGDIEDGRLIYVTELLVVMLILKVLVFGECLMGFHASRKRDTLGIVAYVILVILTLLLYSCFLYTVTNGREELILGLEELELNIRHSYTGTMKQNHFNDYFNNVMHFWNCCGGNNFEDFKDKKAMLESERQLSMNWLKINLSFPLDMPLICCKREVTLQIRDIFGNDSINDKGSVIEDLLSCAQADSEANNKDRGCYNVLWDELEGIITNTPFIAINVACIGLLLSAVVSSIICLQMKIFESHF